MQTAFQLLQHPLGRRQTLLHMDAQRRVGLHILHIAPRQLSAAYHQHVLEIVPARAHSPQQPPNRGALADEHRAAGEKVYGQHAARKVLQAEHKQR